MYRVIVNSIYITRGDTAHLPLRIIDSDHEYIPTDQDKIVFSLKKDITKPDYVLQKEIKNNVLVLNPEDTQNLECGRYTYDVQITLEDGTVETIIPPHIFKVMSEVT